MAKSNFCKLYMRIRFPFPNPPTPPPPPPPSLCYAANKYRRYLVKVIEQWISTRKHIRLTMKRKPLDCLLLFNFGLRFRLAEETWGSDHFGPAFGKPIGAPIPSAAPLTCPALPRSPLSLHHNHSLRNAVSNTQFRSES